MLRGHGELPGRGHDTMEGWRGGKGMVEEGLGQLKKEGGGASECVVAAQRASL